MGGDWSMVWNNTSEQKRRKNALFSFSDRPSQSVRQSVILRVYPPPGFAGLKLIVFIYLYRSYNRLALMSHERYR